LNSTAARRLETQDADGRGERGQSTTQCSNAGNENEDKHRKRDGERRGSYRPERGHGGPAGDGEPDPAVADEVLRGADEERGPEREHGAERAGEEPHAVAEVLGDAESGEVALVVPQRRLDHRREAAEEVPDARARLHPHRRDEHQPPVPQEPAHPAAHLHHCAAPPPRSRLSSDLHERGPGIERGGRSVVAEERAQDSERPGDWIVAVGMVKGRLAGAPDPCAASAAAWPSY
jgi:hypothetical protein